MFSFGKLIVLAAVITGVFLAFRAVERLGARRARDEERLEKSRAKRRGVGREQVSKRQRAGASSGAGGGADASEMARCPVCGAYVSVDAATGCGRDDCPIGR